MNKQTANTVRQIAALWRRGCYVLLLFFILSACGYAQTLRISATVLDENTRRPVADVNISFGSEGGTTTDAAGRFILQINNAADAPPVTFRHISYELREFKPTDLRGLTKILLRPRIIPLQQTEISGKRPEGIAARDIQLSVTSIEADEFEGRGYIDAGDLLRGHHELQVDEEFSGRKTLSMRGGNPDDVIVLYNGMKLNDNSDNIYDLSLIDLADIGRFELIKGSNTTLYGPDAFSGVVNIVPLDERPYTVRAQQQIGSYDAGTWGAQLYRRFGRWNAGYSVRNGANRRSFEDVPDLSLRNTFVTHSAHVGYDVAAERGTAGRVQVNFRYSGSEYINERDEEALDNSSLVAVGQYTGAIAGVEDLLLSAGWTGLDRTVELNTQTNAITRSSADQSLQTRLEKLWRIGSGDLLLSWQFSQGALDAEDRTTNVLQQPVGYTAFTVHRRQHALVAIGKLRGDTESPFLQHFNFDVAVRHDIVSDEVSDVELRENSTASLLPTGQDWSHSLFKFAVSLAGIRDDVLLDVFLSYGNNIKFPTLSQIVNVPSLLHPDTTNTPLEAETNRGVELGISVTRTFAGKLISGWEISGGLFQNTYANKIRSITTPGIPVTLYDNVDDASITGLEASAGIYIAGKIILAEVGLSQYFISDLSAFPFRSEHKRTLGLTVSHAGHSLRLLAFQEGEQVGVLRMPDGNFAESTLPAFSNLDIHAGSSFTIGGIGAFLNISLRNILNGSDAVLSGLALRDRRYYVTIGAQY